MKYIKPVVKEIKKPYKFIKVFLKQKAGWLDMPKIVPFRGYGNEQEVLVSGMVVEDKGLSKPKDKQYFWQNALATIKRFSSDEIPGVKVKATFHGKSLTTLTDELGFFSFHFKFYEEKADLIQKKWHKVNFELLDEVVENQPEIRASAEVRTISREQPRIIISDIDDTALVSHSTQIIRKLRLMLLKNAHSRNPFPGVSKFYQALSAGKDKNENNPLFFVSSSEWNLYDLLVDFFSFNHFPKGVFLLRRLDHSIFQFWKSGGGSHKHKYEKLKSLLQFYPEQKIVLIGDSGQQDPEIYFNIAMEFPHRIEAIYIRKIRSRSYHQKNTEVIGKLAEVKTKYVEVKDTFEAAKHASDNGLVSMDLIMES